MAVLPQPRYFGIPALVRREWQAEERDAQRERARSGERERDWGPPRSDVTVRRAALVLAGLVAATAAGVWAFGLYWTPERPLLIFLVPALLLGRGRRYLLDFAPFALLILLYAELRGVAHWLRPHPYYHPQLDLERFIFGHVPSAVLQRWLWSGHPHWYDSAVGELLKIHFVVPAVLAFCLWIKRRAFFYKFAAAMLVLSFAGAVTFAIYPAAPPWAAHQMGILPNVAQLPPDRETVSSVSAIIGSPTPAGTNVNNVSLAHVIPKNPYAAIPSLHGGYAFLVFIFVTTLVWRWRSKWRWLLIGAGAFYVAAQSFAVVYTGNHYVVDLVIGYAFATGALVAVQRAWRRFGLPQ